MVMTRHSRDWRRARRLLTAAVAAALTGCSTLSKRSEPASPEIAEAIAGVYPAIVRLDVLVETAANGRMRKERGFGSGVIIHSDGYLITNHHVAGRARRILCRLADGEEVEGEVVGTDALSDITVVRLKMEQRRSRRPLTVAHFGDSDALRVGDAVLAMGSPGGIAQSVTRGIVSNTALIMPGGAVQLDGENVGSLVRWIAHDARIFPGNSGGPLVNLEGQIVGINEIAFAGIGGAIPGNLARSIAEQIIERRRVERSWIGLLLQPNPKSLAIDRGGLIASVLPDSPAAASGLRPGDILLSFDGVAVQGAMPEDMPIFNALVLSTPIGKTVTVRYLREGQERETRLTTRRREAARGSDRELRAWGITAQNFTLFSALASLRDSTDGVAISSVSASGPAAQADPALQPGDVIIAVDGRPVRNIAELEEMTDQLLKGREEPRPVLTAFERGRNHFLTVVRVGPPPRPDRPERPKRPDFHAVLQAISPALAEALGLPDNGGIRIAYVFPGLSADQAGLRTGDIITSFDGQPVRARRPEDVMAFTRQIRARKVGAVVPMEILRNGEVLKLEMTLAESVDAGAETDRFEASALDFDARALTLTDRALRKLPDDVNGVLVERVEPASATDLAGLRAGDLVLSVAGAPTPDIPALESAVRSVSGERPRWVLLFVRRGVNTFFVEIEPDWKRGTAAETDETEVVSE